MEAKARKVVGLTGNMAVGKSTVSSLLAAKGAYTIDMDQMTRRALEPDGPGFRPVVEAFGTGILDDTGAIDRRRLGSIVFADPAQLRVLEGILHPVVFALAQAELAQAGEAPLVVIEAIKLLEAGMTRRLCDEIWVVVAETEQQLVRLQETRDMPPAEARQRLAHQSSQAWKMAQADRIIHNRGTLPELACHVDRIWAEACA